MASLIAVSLVCASTLVNPQDCTVDTALDIIQTPIENDMPHHCIMVGQTAVATAHLIEEGDNSRYVRVLCRRRQALASATPAP